ncbi:ABC transporter permease [Acuticoccus mangrovi]|uniref:ABC transporter permease n=1 Tax=Acuticoccus mangrovi TaxID=2796142 RepID=A0A934IUL6_9HYPH|nr:ABC transporter permease [Acuticoccus mangrovi]MBJ3778868.1 ABC transporter permease [Acuticoccus mangrovi]
MAAQQVGPRNATWLLGLPGAAAVIIFVIVPYINIAVMSFRVSSPSRAYDPGFTLDNYARTLGDPLYLGVLWDTVSLAVIVAVVSLVLGFPVAFFLARTRSRWQSLLYALVLSPLLVGVVIRSFGWIVLLANNGVINQLLGMVGIGPLGLMYNRLGVTIGLVHVFLPFMILPIMNAVQSIDPRFEEAARTLGASERRAFFRVVLPLSMPGIQSGAILVFVLAASAYVVPELLGGGRVMTTPTFVMQQLLGTFLWPFGAALALVLSATTLILIWLFTLLTKPVMRGLT